MNFGKRELEEAIAKNPVSFPLNVLYEHFEHFEALGRNGIDEGNSTYLIDGIHYTYDSGMVKKQETLFRAGQVSKHALQIGCYIGHSLLLLLISNPTLTITVIDPDDAYASSAVEYLNAQFGNRVHFMNTSSAEGMKMLEGNTYDLIHFDNPDDAKLFYASRRLAKNGTFYIFNHYERVQLFVEELISKTILKAISQPECLFGNKVTYLVE